MIYTFSTELFRYPGKGGWVFAKVPKEYKAPYKLAWGRTPVKAQVDGKSWPTSSVWTDKSGEILLPVPGKIRAGKDHGDTVQISLNYN